MKGAGASIDLSTLNSSRLPWRCGSASPMERRTAILSTGLMRAYWAS